METTLTEENYEDVGERQVTVGSIDGITLPQFTADNWDTIQNFQAREDDVVIVTYPKSEGDMERSVRVPCFIKVPFIEMVGLNPMPSAVELADNRSLPIIYLAENAKDCLVSYYFFHKMIRVSPDPGTWDDFFSSFLSGDILWGSWFDHVIGWWKAVDKHRILYVFYEDLMEDPKREVIKVMKFLGKDLCDDVVERIVDHTTFKAMRENPMTISPYWKNHFSVAQNMIFDEEYKKRLEGSDLTFRTELSQRI
ncbi:hypothetical protein GDO86_020528 [Hymenochirus boettgeri]|uniref:Sulfotransferase n=1 Tax=Hymenochirus boettgeri TaxID=247094 RepID=A0A8T2ID17_9PIPI|nr:hypothetical protein GDO86_020528 [Hymenochirus boettgeri]